MGQLAWWPLGGVTQEGNLEIACYEKLYDVPPEPVRSNGHGDCEKVE